MIRRQAWGHLEAWTKLMRRLWREVMKHFNLQFQTRTAKQDKHTPTTSKHSESTEGQEKLKSSKRSRPWQRSLDPTCITGINNWNSRP